MLQLTRSVQLARLINARTVYYLGPQYLVIRMIFSSTKFHTNLPSNSPWRIFVETFKNELKKNSELQENIKALQDSSRELSESENFKRAQEAYNKARNVGEQASTIGNRTIKMTAKIVGNVTIFTWQSAPIRLFRYIVSKFFMFAAIVTAPIRNSSAYKAVREVIDDGSSSRYGGYVEKSIRKERREKLRSSSARPAKTKVNTEAGENLVLHKDSAWKESWKNYKDQSKIFQGMNRFQKSYDQSEHPIIASIRDFHYKISDTFTGLSSENETAKVIRIFQEMSPSFMIENFLRELREYILPEIVDAYVLGDAETLKIWFSEAPFSVWQIGAKEYMSKGIKPDGKILDIRSVDIHSARLIPPNNIPVLVISFRTQEVQTYRDIKTGKIVAGEEDGIQQVTYAAVFTRIDTELSNIETRGWRVIEFARARSVNYY